MIKYKRSALNNGLTVLSNYDSTTPMVALNIIYKVGSKNEDKNKTGLAHLFEHLMFGGSENVPDFDTPVQMACGENNAFTTLDYTNYYMVLPKENVETAFWLESDRMLSLNLNQTTLDTQKSVVLEEYNQRYNNKPYGDLWKILREMCYKQHPYRWQTIGKKASHFQSATLQDMLQFYNQFYSPNNAILSVSGGLTHQEVVDLAEKWFGDIESKGDGVWQTFFEPKQIKARRVEVERDVPVSTIYICFNVGKRKSETFVVCDTISDILSGGSSSRMVHNLIKEKKLFNSVNAYLTGEVDLGLLVVTGQVADGADLVECESALWEELEELKTNLVGEYELQKVKNKFEVNSAFGELNVMNKAMNLGFYEMLGDIEYINKEVEAYQAVSSEDIMRVSNELFVKPKSSTLVYKAILKNEE